VGGVLLGAVAARFTRDLDPELVPDLVALTHEVEAGRRIAQPRLRYRLQDDRIGLTRSTHRLFRHGPKAEMQVSFDDDRGLPGQMVLGAIYSAQTLPAHLRGAVLVSIRRGIGWSGDIGPALLAYLAGRGTMRLSADALSDPVGWALQVLGFGLDQPTPERADIQKSFRQSLIAAHPDHGGDDLEAAERIAEITEARRILMA